MNLSTKEEQTNFLKKCREHIMRIYSSCEHDERIHFADKQGAQLEEGEKNNILGELPSSIDINHGHYKDSTTDKLDVLTSIYNKVASAVSDSKGLTPVDLEEIYFKVKHVSFKEMNIDATMNYHRNGFARFLSLILSFWKPKSADFLDKTGFFSVNIDKRKDKFKPLVQDLFDTCLTELKAYEYDWKLIDTNSFSASQPEVCITFSNIKSDENIKGKIEAAFEAKGVSLQPNEFSPAYELKEERGNTWRLTVKIDTIEKILGSSKNLKSLS